MVREYSWRLRVRSYEGDVWRQVTASGWLRYLEQVAVDAAASIGYDRAFHMQYGTTWVIRRMTLQIHVPARIGEDLEIVTWPSHQERVRGWREYKVGAVGNEESKSPYVTALGEWVYMDRKTLRPVALPRDFTLNVESPGAPLGTYEPPPVAPLAEGQTFTMQRTARWHECDSMEHVNNAVYADWLDEAMRAAVDEIGFPMARLKDAGLQLRGLHYRLDYKRAVLPEDRVLIDTRIVSAEGRLCAVEQSIHAPDGGTQYLQAKSVYAWLNASGEETDAPEGWFRAVRSEGAS